MQVRVDDLANRIEQSVANGQSGTGGSVLPKLILLNGNEPLLVEEALDQARQALKKAGFAERIKYQLETGFDWSLISSAGQSMSLFSEKRVVELRVPKSLGVTGTKAIAEYCQAPPNEDDILILIMPFLDKKQRNAKWYKAVTSVAWVVDSHEISTEQFPKWISQRLQSRSLRVENGVIEMLVQQLEGNVMAAAQEIDKLQVLAKDGGVTLSLLTECMADQARFDVYQLTDTALIGDFTKTRRILSRLKTEGIEPVIIVWALVREVRALSVMAALMQQGQSRDSVFKKCRVWNKRQAVVRAALNRHPVQTWYNLLQQSAHLDQTVKGQRYDGVGSAWHQIEQLCGDICGANPLVTPISNVA